MKVCARSISRTPKSMHLKSTLRILATAHLEVGFRVAHERLYRVLTGINGAHLPQGVEQPVAQAAGPHRGDSAIHPLQQAALHPGSLPPLPTPRSHNSA
eukprot:1178612-Prorocentrum_minimum.AAC.2